MKIVRLNVSTGNDAPGGHVGAPQELHWREEWLENQSRWVLLTCGCIDDITDRSTIIINSFKGSTVYCERCCLFAGVVRTLKCKAPPVKQPETPPF